MNDTHGEKGKGWYGFDLDGTLAKYDGWKGIDHIGEPVQPMVWLVKRMHDEGKVVKIMTARVAPRDTVETRQRERCKAPEYIVRVEAEPCDRDWLECMYTGLDLWGAREFIVDWCARNLGFIPEIVYQKDHLMLELYDDRVKQVVPNEGWLVEDIARSKRQRTETVLVKREVVNAKWYDRIGAFLLGMLVAMVLALACEVSLHRRVAEDPEAALQDALTTYLEVKAHAPVVEAVGRLLP